MRLDGSIELKINKFFILVSLLVLVFCCANMVSASLVSEECLNNLDDSIISCENLSFSDSADEISYQADVLENGIDFESHSSSCMESNKLGSSENFVVNNSNFNTFFDSDNVLKGEYGGQIITFDGDFADKGIITIDSDNTKITGRDALFRNTVFNLKADGVMLTNLHLVLDEDFVDNEGAGVLISANNVTVYNVSIDYNVPKNVTGFGIYSNGLDEGLSGVNLVNNTVNLCGNALNRGYNYGIVLTNTRDAFVSGNTINCSLPLRAVDWMAGVYGGISMDAVAGFAADSCNNLVLSNNYIKCVVNGVAQGEPTLDAVLIYACHNSTIEKNTILENDFITAQGNVNYLYGLDLYLSNDVVIYGNDIHIQTTGGKEAHGTAYPIQITGQAENIRVAYNNLTSYSFGPNIGIYSQNYYGRTTIDIINNFINVTGYASKHSWALVAGIEVQDSDDRIMNNTIIVGTVNEFEKGFNVYGISYSQSTQGDHNYNVQYNNVSTNSDYAVALKGGGSSTVSDSIVANNILNGRRYGGNRAVYVTGGTGNIVVNNTDGSKPVAKMSESDLPDWLRDYKSPISRGLGLSWLNSGGHGNLFNGSGSGNGFNFNSDVNGNNSRFSRSNSTRGDLNSTRYAVGDSGVSLAAASASAGSADSSGVDKRAYEIEDGDNPLVKSADYFQLGIVVLAVLLLLLVGYKRQKDKEEEE